ncbi:MAG: hypothetical protein IKN54_00780 [Lachnospiraceae bacterium]|nr:hypothetical protein [Lachnospiraceae bacterium]
MTKTEMLMNRSAGHGRPKKKKPDVIYCCDCKKYQTMFCAIDIWTEDVIIYRATPDDYCSRAERREE